MPFSDQPWSADESAYSDAAAFCAACLIDENPAGKPKAKGLCKLPVKGAGGGYNRNAIHAAWAALAGARGGVQASAESKRQAARKLVRLYREMGDEVPPAMVRMAGL